MHEMAMRTVSMSQSYMRGVAGAVLCSYGDDVSVLQLRFDRGDPGIRDVGDGQGGNMGLDFGDFRDEGAVAAEIAIVFPRSLHFLHVTANGDTAKGFGDIGPKAAFFVVGEYFLQMVHAADVGTVAATVAIAFEFDVMEHRFF